MCGAREFFPHCYAGDGPAACRLGAGRLLPGPRGLGDSLLTGLVMLLVCQLVGEVVARSLGLPVPGPVVGMLVFFVVLQVRRPSHGSGLVRAPQTLLRHLPLLYVPVGVGVVAYLSVLGASVVPVGLGLVASWLVGLLVTASVTALLLRLTGQKRVVG